MFERQFAGPHLTIFTNSFPYFKNRSASVSLYCNLITQADGSGPSIQSTICLSDQINDPFGCLIFGGKRANHDGATAPIYDAHIK